MAPSQKMVIVGAGPVGSLAALYAAQRNYQVELYELRPGQSACILFQLQHPPAITTLPTPLCSSVDDHPSNFHVDILNHTVQSSTPRR